MATAEEEERTITEALDDVIANIITLDSEEASSDTEPPVFSYMEMIGDESDAVSFTAELENAAVQQTLTEITSQRIGNVFHGSLVNTGAAERDTAGHSQYLAYCFVRSKSIMSTLPVLLAVILALNLPF